MCDSRALQRAVETQWQTKSCFPDARKDLVGTNPYTLCTFCTFLVSFGKKMKTVIQNSSFSLILSEIPIFFRIIF